MMSKFLKAFTEPFSDSLPPVLKDLKGEFEQELNRVITLTLQKLDLVTREEFEIQCQVLARTRQKVKVLEQKIADLEKEISI